MAPVEAPIERNRCVVIEGLAGQQARFDGCQITEIVGGSNLRWMIEQEISIWLSQEAWVGRWTMIMGGAALGALVAEVVFALLR